jgi:hypothetical protein
MNNENRVLRKRMAIIHQFSSLKVALQPLRENIQLIKGMLVNFLRGVCYKAYLWVIW